MAGEMCPRFYGTEIPLMFK